MLNNKNDKISYIPVFNDLYSEEIEEQIYASTIIGENMKIREALKSQEWEVFYYVHIAYSLAHVNWPVWLCSTVQQFWINI